MGQKQSAVQNTNIQIIDFNTNVYANAYRHKYIIKLDKSIGSDVDIIISNHVIHSSSYKWRGINSLSRDLNKNTESLVFCYNEKYYQITGIVGNIYLLWAERINQRTVNQILPIINENIPLIIETDGKNGYRNIFILHGEQHVHTDDCEIVEPYRYNLFSLDCDPRNNNIEKHISTISDSEAEFITKTPVARELVSMDNEEAPYASDTDEVVLTITKE